MSRAFVLNWSTSPPLAVAAVISNSTDPRFWRLTTTLTRPSTWPSGTRFTTNNSLLPRLSGNYWHFEWNYFFLTFDFFFIKSMEVTPLVVLPHSGRYPSNLYPMYTSSSRNKSPVIHPSPYQNEAKLQQQQLQQQQRIFFSALSLANVFNKGTVTFTTFKTGKIFSYF